MTPRDLAELHGRSISTPAPWDALTFAAFLKDPTIHLIAQDQGFLLLRTVADEAEVLTLAVDPGARRRGLGRDLVAKALDYARSAGVGRVFLEVAANNQAALGLYDQARFSKVGTRPGYYLTGSGERVDALIMERELTQGNPPSIT